MSARGSSKQSLFSAGAAAKKSRAGRAETDAPLVTVQDYIDLLRTAFEDLFEIAVAPEEVVDRLRREVADRRMAATEVIGPDLVDHDLRLSIRKAEGDFVTITVRPEGDCEVQGLDE